MNKAQLVVLALIGLSALLMFLYPPYYVEFANGTRDHLGYRYLFDPPYRRGFVHTPTLLVQYLGLLIVGGVAWLLAGAISWRKRISPAGTADPAPPRSFRGFKRVCVTFIAFLASGVLIALWQENLPGGAVSGALMAAVAIGLVFGVWRWSASFK